MSSPVSTSQVLASKAANATADTTSAAPTWRTPAAHDLIHSIIDKHFRAAKEAAEEEVQEQWKQEIARLTAKVHEMFIARLEASHGVAVEKAASP